MVSGLVLNDEVKWVSFHSSYDFGYLLKTLTCKDLPDTESAFLELLQVYFPSIFDMKYVMTAVEGMYGGLNGLADILQVERIGPMHQAGSDSMLTSSTFFTLIEKHLGGVIDDSRFRGELFGLGSNHTKYRVKGFQPTTPAPPNGTGMVITMSGGGGAGALHHSTSRDSMPQLHHSNSRDMLAHQGTASGGMIHYSQGGQMYASGYGDGMQDPARY